MCACVGARGERERGREMKNEKDTAVERERQSEREREKDIGQYVFVLFCGGSGELLARYISVQCTPSTH